MRKIDETTIPYLKKSGYGKGTNFTVDLVASLMLQYAGDQNREERQDTERLRDELALAHISKQELGMLKEDNFLFEEITKSLAEQAYRFADQVIKYRNYE